MTSIEKEAHSRLHDLFAMEIANTERLRKINNILLNQIADLKEQLSTTKEFTA
jgi:hypothetical protein